MFKRISATLLALSISVNLAKPVEILKSHLFIPDSLGDIRLFHEKNSFFILKDNEKIPVQNAFISKELRNLSDEQLGKYLGTIKELTLNGQKIQLTKISDETSNVTPLFQLSESDSQEILKALSSSAYISISLNDKNEYNLSSSHRLPGGGFWGAIGGAWAGKIISSAIIHGSMAVVFIGVSVVATPVVAGIVVGTLETTLAAPIEAVTTAAALAGGIAGAVATGPI